VIGDDESLGHRLQQRKAPARREISTITSVAASCRNKDPESNTAAPSRASSTWTLSMRGATRAAARKDCAAGRLAGANRSSNAPAPVRLVSRPKSAEAAGLASSTRCVPASTTSDASLVIWNKSRYRFSASRMRAYSRSIV
jgi:hypothetical protein